MFPCPQCGGDRKSLEASCLNCGWRPSHVHESKEPLVARKDSSSTDADQLRLLSIFHYVVSGILALFSLFPVLHLVVGIAIVSGAFDDFDQGGPPPAVFGWFFIGIALFFIICGLTFSICIAVAGRRLSRHTSYLYCLVMAGVECVFMPFGTVLGAFTIIVLSRPSVKELFGRTEW